MLITLATHTTKQLTPCQKEPLSRYRTSQKTTLVFCQMRSCQYIGLKNKPLFIRLLFSGKLKIRVREDHFVFISDDLKHDIPFVEICNCMIHKHYYTDRNIPVTRDIEFNDGCSSQFKCINPFAQFSYRSVPTTRAYFETSHGKSKSDGLGGVVKCAATREVNGRQVIIRNTQELFEFCREKLTVENSQTNKALLNRIFYFVSTNELDEYRLQAPNEKHSTVKGTRKIHQIFNGSVTKKGFYH